MYSSDASRSDGLIRDSQLTLQRRLADDSNETFCWSFNLSCNYGSHRSVLFYAWLPSRRRHFDYRKMLFELNTIKNY